MQSFRLVFWFAAVVFLVETRAHAGSFGFSTIHVPGAVLTEIGDVSIGGVIVGTYQDTTQKRHGFRWDRGVFQAIDVPGATSTSLSGINDEGTIVGTYQNPSGRTVGFILPRGGSAQSIPVPGGLLTEANDINNNDIVVGECSVGSLRYGCWTNLRLRTFGRVAVPTLNATDGRIMGINDANTIVGWYWELSVNFYAQAFRWHNLGAGALTLITDPRAAHTYAAKISNDGTIVGTIDENTFSIDLTHGFVWRNNRTTLVNVPGYSRNALHAIDAGGTVYGSYSFAVGVNPQSYSWQSQRFTVIDFPGSVRTEARGISDNGIVVGTYADARGKTRGFRLADTNFRSIDYPVGQATTPTAVSLAGIVVGTYRDVNGNDRGFRWANGVFTAIDWPGARSTVPTAITNQGTILGRYIDANYRVGGFRFVDGRFQRIEVPCSAISGVPAGMSNDGSIVAQCNLEHDRFGLMVSANTTTEIRHPSSFSGSRSLTEVRGVNGTGLVVGQYVDSTGGTRGFLWIAGRFVASFDAPGNAGRTFVSGINNGGTVVGSFRDARDRWHGFAGLP